MAAKSTTPSNEQLEMDQLAEAELERLQRQVLCRFNRSMITHYYFFDWPVLWIIALNDNRAPEHVLFNLISW